MEERLQPGELVRAVEDAVGDRGTVDLVRLVEDLATEAVEQRGSHLLFLADQPVDDLVARDHRGAVALERGQGLALARADTARDGDGDRPGHYSGGGSGGAPSESPGPGSSAATLSASMLSSTCSAS